MKKELYETKGTIAHVFVSNKEKIFALMQPSTFNALKSLINSLLDTEELKGNPAIENAKVNLSNKGFNLYTSTLMTYMTGSKVS